jgi:arylsulfatase A-like enzyme
VILCIDTLRADHLGVYGYARDTSPRIDELAARGVVFEHAYSHSPWTVPSTASLLTSQLPREHGAGLSGRLDRNLRTSPPGKVSESAISIAQALKEAGFRSALLSANPFVAGSFQRGFDMAVSERQSASQLTDRAIQWLEEDDSAPFLLYMQYVDLHEPTQPPEPFASAFPVSERAGPRTEAHKKWGFGKLSGPEQAGFESFKEHKLALYDGALRYVDSELGRLLERIDGLVGLDTTLVVVVSDHGEEFWDHAAIERQLGGDPRGIWGIGHGHSMFEEQLHVPLIFAGPGLGGGRLDCEVGLIDVVPTLLEALGVEIPPAMRGSSLNSLLRAGGRDDCPDKPVIAESPAYGPDTNAVVWRRHKLIQRADGVDLLYSLRDDPQERDETGSPRVLEGLRGVLAAHRETAVSDPSGAMTYDEDTRSQLESLGYLSPPQK